MNTKSLGVALFVTLLASGLSSAGAVEQKTDDFQDKFRQLEEVLPTPNDYRNAAGEPGKEYWQQ